MNHKDSDIDLFTAYIVPTIDILSGENIGNGSHNQQSTELDIVSHEIGKIINELIKGNINFLVGTLSTTILCQRKHYLDDLKQLLNEYGQTKSCKNSIRGLAFSNYKKYIINCNSDKKEQLITKKCNTINRTLLFGINVLNGNGFKFMPTFNQTPEDVTEMLDLFDKTVIKSKIPEKTNPKPFRDFLSTLRIKELNGEL